MGPVFKIRNDEPTHSAPLDDPQTDRGKMKRIMKSTGWLNPNNGGVFHNFTNNHLIINL